MRKLLITAAILTLPSLFAIADTATTIVIKDGNLVNHNMNVISDGSGNLTNTQGVRNLPSTNYSVLISNGLTFQQLLPSVTDGSRQSLEIQNNQISGTDVCYVLYGSNIASQVTPGTTTTSSNLTINSNTVPAGGAAKVIVPGQPFTRYYPYVPSDAFFVTCSTTGDSLQVTLQ